MAAADSFRIVVTGAGGHAAMPHLTADPVVAASLIVVALQAGLGSYLRHVIRQRCLLL